MALNRSAPAAGDRAVAGASGGDALAPGSPLRVLFLEDSDEDALLVERELRAAGLRFVLRRCVSRDAFAVCLSEFDPQVILSDFSVPGFGGLSAMKMARESRPGVPFIVVSGAIGEEMAIGILKSGATDYVLKHRLSRLPLAVTRAVKEVAEQAERRRAEEALRASEERVRQAQKMEAIGRLAGGVAHDFNNVLMVIRIHTDLLMRRLGSEDPSRPAIEEIGKAAEHAATLTQQLLAFGRKQTLRPRVLDMNATVVEMDGMLRRLIGEHIDLTTSRDPSLIPIQMDPGQLEQVIMNLTVNARDAMPGGGKLTLETKNTELAPNDDLARAGAHAGRYARLTVRDTGCGMDASTQERIFEPFFTTKPERGGTGLGLATVYGIVNGGGGHIEVESEPGRGTAFRIYFPAAPGTATAPDRAAALTGSAEGAETVLVVEDQKCVRDVVGEALSLYGYRVLSAEGFEEALAICRSHPGPIHLLLSDLVMPGMNGPEVARRLAALRPDMRVLFMSGYPGEALSVDQASSPDLSLLQKPFLPETLARKVREVLESPRSGAAVATTVE